MVEMARTRETGFAEIELRVALRILSLGAAFCLGMLEAHEGFERYGCAVLGADSAIGVICLLSPSYWYDDLRNPRINALRIVGLLLSHHFRDPCIHRAAGTVIRFADVAYRVRITFLASQQGPVFCALFLLHADCCGSNRCHAQGRQENQDDLRTRAASPNHFAA